MFSPSTILFLDSLLSISNGLLMMYQPVFSTFMFLRIRHNAGMEYLSNFLGIALFSQGLGLYWISGLNSKRGTQLSIDIRTVYWFLSLFFTMINKELYSSDNMYLLNFLMNLFMVSLNLMNCTLFKNDETLVNSEPVRYRRRVQRRKLLTRSKTPEPRRLKKREVCRSQKCDLHKLLEKMEKLD